MTTEGDRRFMALAMCMHDYGDSDIDLLGATFRKVWSGMERLKSAL